MNDWNDEYKARVRHLIERKGRPVEINPNPRFVGDDVSTYGWVDYKAEYHTRKHDKYCQANCTDHADCEWIIPMGALLQEKTYSMFTDTYSGNADEVGVNVSPAHCACGKYTDVTLRYTASFGDMLREVLRDDENPRVGIEL